MAKDEIESTIISSEYPLENPLGRPVKATLGMQSLLFQEQRAHNRRQRQRYNRRCHHRDRYGDCEFAEQTADDAAHREQRDEDCDQRERDRNDREADLAGALKRRLERPVALLDVAHDVSIMTIASSITKPTEMVSAISEMLSRLKPATYMTENVASSDNGTARLGITVAHIVRRNRKMTMTTSEIVNNIVNCTSRTAARVT